MKDLLTRALDAHGGLSRWREIEAFQLKVSIGGGLWRLKGLPDGLRDVTLRIQAHRQIVTITPFGGEARTGHFTPDRVWVEEANGGVVEERATPRASFAEHVLTTPWDIAGTLLRELRPVELPGHSVRVHCTRLRDP